MEAAELRRRGVKKGASTEGKKPAATNPPAPSFWGKVLTRVITGACLIFGLTVILLSDHAIVSLFTTLVQVLVFREITALRYVQAKEKNLQFFRLPNWSFLLATLFFVYGKQVMLHNPIEKYVPLAHLVRYHLLMSFIIYCIGFVLFILTLQNGLYKYQFKQLTWTLMTLLFIVFQANFMTSNIYSGLVWFLLPCAIIVCNDIAAYFCGLFLGRKFVHRQFMAISPNKTWEGFVGATFWTIIFAFFFADFLARYQWMVCPKASSSMFEPLHCIPDPVFAPKDYIFPLEISNFLRNSLGLAWDHVTIRPIQIHAIVFALFGSLIAPFGGFYASAIKRAYSVKDFDNLFPGHGGVTDRTDCQYIMGFFMYVYLRTFIQASQFDTNELLEAVLMLSLSEQQMVYDKLGDALAGSGAAENAAAMLS